MKLTHIIHSLILIFGIKSNNAEYLDDAVIVIEEAFKDGYITTAWGQDVDEDFISDFLVKLQIPVITLKGSEKFTNAYEPIIFSQTVVLAKDPYEFYKLITEINILILNPIQVIVILEKIRTEDVKAFTDVAYTNDIGDIIIISLDTSGQTQLSTYFPYGNGRCGNSDPKILNPKEGMFPRKFQNFYGCPMRVTVLNFIPYVQFSYTNDTSFHIGGFDGRVLKHIIATMNATIDIVVSDNASQINTTTLGAIEIITEELADIMLPSVLITMERYQLAQILYIYDTFDFIFCIPNRQEIYQWARVLMPFYNYHTLTIVISFAAFFMSIKIIRRYKKFKYRKSITFGLYGLFFTQVAKFRTGPWLVNALLILWVWYSFIVRIAYQGELIQGLGLTILEPATETVDEALKVVDEIASTRQCYEFFKNTSIAERFKALLVPEIEENLKAISMGKKTMLILDDMLLRLYGYKVQVLTERVANSPACLLMRPRWPAATEMRLIMARSAEAGLIPKIVSQSRFSYVLQYNSTRTHSTYEPLQMITISSCFYGLMAMWGVCFLILLLEILNKMYTRK